jgi:trehalose 6-phosphate synthase
MNLVAKEYVAAQDRNDPGVLILSRFTGAAAQLSQALLVNPHSPEEIADAIAQALEMPLDERKWRWTTLMDNVEREDVVWWHRVFSDVMESDALLPAVASPAM